jgi:alpha-D-xyloside xylohydrolase
MVSGQSNGWSCDIGGFNWWYADCWDDGQPYAQLLTRWYQFAGFVPLFRDHGAHHCWAETKKCNRTTPEWQGRNESIYLRYDLVPYTYTYQAENYWSGVTLTRLLAFDYPQDQNVWDIKDEFKFGKELFVAPVLEFNVTSRSIYFPAGRWYDWHTNDVIEGPVRQDWPVVMQWIPLFAHAGAIVPCSGDFILSTAQQIVNLRVRVYAGADGTFTLYEDDGVTMTAKTGAWRRTPFTYDDKARTVTVGPTTGGWWPNQKRGMEFILYSNKPPLGYPESKSVFYNGTQISVQF